MCAYVSSHLSIFIQMHAYAHLCTSVAGHECLFTSMSTCMYIFSYLCTPMYTHLTPAYTRLHLGTPIHMQHIHAFHTYQCGAGIPKLH